MHCISLLQKSKPFHNSPVPSLWIAGCGDEWRCSKSLQLRFCAQTVMWDAVNPGWHRHPICSVWALLLPLYCIHSFLVGPGLTQHLAIWFIAWSTQALAESKLLPPVFIVPRLRAWFTCYCLDHFGAPLSEICHIELSFGTYSQSLGRKQDALH